MGGKELLHFLAPAGSGENTLVTCVNGDYAADLEVALAIPPPPEFPQRIDAPEEIETPGITTIEALAGCRSESTQPPPRRRCPSSRSRESSFWRLSAATTGSRRRSSRRRSRPTSVRRPRRRSGRRSAPTPGSLGPGRLHRRSGRRRDPSGRAVRCGREPQGFHLRGVEHGRDFEARFADLRQPVPGDSCPRCGGRLEFQTAIEVGHIFKFGTRYSKPIGATFLDEDGTEKALVGGSYGIGPGTGHGGGGRAASRPARDLVAGEDRAVRRPRCRALRSGGDRRACGGGARVERPQRAARRSRPAAGREASRTQT